MLCAGRQRKVLASGSGHRLARTRHAIEAPRANTAKPSSHAGPRALMNACTRNVSRCCTSASVRSSTGRSGATRRRAAPAAPPAPAADPTHLGLPGHDGAWLHRLAAGGRGLPGACSRGTPTRYAAVCSAHQIFEKNSLIVSFTWSIDPRGVRRMRRRAAASSGAPGTGAPGGGCHAPSAADVRAHAAPQAGR